MTSEAPEPTLGDVMAYLREFSGHVMAEFAKVRADIHDVDAKVDIVEDGLRSEIRAAESRLSGRIDAVKDVVRTAKGDLADHLADPEVHHRHAA